jgi:hypothetical protein
MSLRTSPRPCNNVRAEKNANHSFDLRRFCRIISNVEMILTIPRTMATTSFTSVTVKAAANLNIRWNKRTYVFELVESDTPVLALNLADRATTETVLHESI